jgi:pSer/pThr/pTyr-binding forkhead associated (FHA) protein
VSAIILLVLRLLLAVILYGFLGLAFYIIWRDLKNQGELLIARQPIPITLTTELDSPPLTRHYSSPEIILGREPACDFPINDQTVSSQHARLSYHQNQWWLEDLASTNGTLLNDEPVTTPVVITHGDVLRLGQVGVKIAIGQNQPPVDHSI